jgi:DNA-binding GntR family transcriptional regulator
MPNAQPISTSRTALLTTIDLLPGFSDPIFETIKEKILDGELKPGTKLGEDEIASIFGVGRARARQSLRLLAAVNVVTIERNRGAFVAQPSRQEASEVYAARRLIECASIAIAARKRTERDLQALRKHIELQRTAVAKGSRRDFVRLVMEFHSLLGAMGKNTIVATTINQLLARAAIIAAFYEVIAPSKEAVDEHAAIVRQVAARDATGAARSMESHLKNAESWLEIDEAPVVELDLRQILRPA